LTTIAASTDDEQLQQAVAAARDEASSVSYHTIFGPGGPAAAREVSYQRSSFTGRFLAELQDAYAAFAYESTIGEAPDHVATQADFVGYLRLKEAYARARGDVEQAESDRRTAQRIIADHLALIAEPLAEILQNSDFRYLALAAPPCISESARPNAARCRRPRPRNIGTSGSMRRRGGRLAASVKRKR
jgi:hypothetical protein